MPLQTVNQQSAKYEARHHINNNGVSGANNTSSKFVAWANMKLYSLSATLLVAGTSTYTANGTATINGQQVSVIIIQNTAASGSAPASGTTTLGPFIVGGNFASGGTGTAGVSGSNQFQLNTNTGTAGMGGFFVPKGSVVYCVSGTDATAQTSLNIDYEIAAGSDLMV